MTASTEIAFVVSPKNQTAFPGSSAAFECRLTGTDLLPLWLINNIPYDPLASRLPERIHYTFDKMIVDPVKPVDNGTSFSCYSSFATETPPYLSYVHSDTGILYVTVSDFVTYVACPLSGTGGTGSFTLPQQLTDDLLANKGHLVDIDFQQGYQHFNKGILLDHTTGMKPLELLQQGSGPVSLLAIIENNPEQPTPLTFTYCKDPHNVSSSSRWLLLSSPTETPATKPPKTSLADKPLPGIPALMYLSTMLMALTVSLY